MSKREELEIRIKEQRVLEANKKGLIGSAGKIGTVLRMMGSEIVYQGEESVGADFLNHDEERLEPRDSKELLSYLPTMDVDGVTRPEGKEWGEIGDANPTRTRKIGMHFDGLGRGMHMEIKYDDERSELTLTHKGYLVYKEVMGDIEAYVPNEEWEGWVDSLWSVAKNVQRKRKEEEFKKNTEEADQAKNSWLESLMRRWGRI